MRGGAPSCNGRDFDLKHTKLLWSVLLLTLVLGTAALQLRTDPPPTVKTVMVEYGSIESTLKVTGTVRSQQEVSLSPLVMGRLATLHVNTGQRVVKGQLLAVLDDGDARTRLAAQQAALVSSQRKTAQAQEQVANIRAVWSVGGESQQAVVQAEQQLDAARENQAQVLAQVQQAQQALNNTRIVAPFAGLVASVEARAGQTVQAGMPLLVLLDPTQSEIALKVVSDDTTQITPGQQVEVTSDAAPGVTWVEQVMRIDPTVRRDASASEVTVWVSLGAKAPALRVGQQVDARIRVSYREHALKLPYEVLVRRERTISVAVIDHSMVRFKPVKIGIEDARYVEMLDGVAPSEQVIVPSGLSLNEGQRVTPAKL